MHLTKNLKYITHLNNFHLKIIILYYIINFQQII